MFKLIGLIVVIIVLWAGFIFFGGNGQKEDKYFMISAGQGVNQISQNLFEQKLIKTKLIFESWIWLNQAEGKMIAGNYKIPANISIKNLVSLLSGGLDLSANDLTIIEGWNRQTNKLQELLTARGFPVSEFLAATADKQVWQEQFSFLQDAPVGASLEGYIFPDTYNLDGLTVSDLVHKTLQNFDRKLTLQMRADIAQQNKTIFEIITLASIIEREASQRSNNAIDDNMVADIFWKRLKIGMPLQSDATVNFATGKSLTRPTLDDLEIDSPYNTYKNPGLPPGPIANPGLTSIEAVIYPQSNPYYYFLTTDDGQFIYAETHDQHVANKAKYLK